MLHILSIKQKKKIENENKKKELFKPYKTTKSNVHDPKKEKQRKQNKYWEVTAATPPLIIHDAAKIINLNESLKLQKEQTERLQEIQAKHAAERLVEQLGLHNIGPSPENIRTYLRDEKESDSFTSEDEEENEVHDEEDNDKGGTVVFTVDSIES